MMLQMIKSNLVKAANLGFWLTLLFAGIVSFSFCFEQVDLLKKLGLIDKSQILKLHSFDVWAGLCLLGLQAELLFTLLSFVVRRRINISTIIMFGLVILSYVSAQKSGVSAELSIAMILMVWSWFIARLFTLLIRLSQLSIWTIHSVHFLNKSNALLFSVILALAVAILIKSWPIIYLVGLGLSCYMLGYFMLLMQLNWNKELFTKP